ncbi:hypothetical protein R1sor_012016 [Riccia sorocarpa]|uniref:Uncharacterized protein n=1 Tax=Riccia sorocarpa TaxID=122646 RepID=A0ABD3I6F0_9MARC
MMSTEEALNTLKQSSTVTGDSVFTHLSELLRHILASKPNNVVDVLEISFLLKVTRYISNENTGFLREGRDPKDVQAVALFLELFATKEPQEIPEDQKPKEKKPRTDSEGESETNTETETETEVTETEEAPTSNIEVENLYADSVFMDAVGVGLGRTEMLMIMLAMKVLGDNPSLGITSLRFFGKYFGTKKNYFVFESLMSGEEEAATEGEEGSEGEDGTKKKPPKEEPLTTTGRCADYEKGEKGGGDDESEGATTEGETEDGTDESSSKQGEEEGEVPPTAEEREVIPESLASVENDKDFVEGVNPWSINYVPPPPPPIQKETKGEFVESTELPLQLAKEGGSATEAEGTEDGATTEGEESWTEDNESIA